LLLSHFGDSKSLFDITGDGLVDMNDIFLLTLYWNP